MDFYLAVANHGQQGTIEAPSAYIYSSLWSCPIAEPMVDHIIVQQHPSSPPPRSSKRRCLYSRALTHQAQQPSTRATTRGSTSAPQCNSLACGNGMLCEVASLAQCLLSCPPIHLPIFAYGFDRCRFVVVAWHYGPSCRSPMSSVAAPQGANAAPLLRYGGGWRQHLDIY